MEIGQTFDGNPEDFTKANAGDERLVVGFYMNIMQNEGKSIEAGRAIFDDVEFVRIYIPGDSTLTIDQPATENYKRRFPQQYQRFKQGVAEEEQTGGTPLTEWPMVTRAQVAELKFLNIRSVEQLANVRDDVKLKVPYLTSLARHAQTWLGKTQVTAEAAKQAKLIEDQGNEIEALKKAVRDLMGKNEALLQRQSAEA